MNEEIYYSIKNAVERGDSLESAARTFINAGYNTEEVNLAMRSLKQGYTPQEQTPENKQGISLPSLPNHPPLPKIGPPQKSEENKQKKPRKIIILLLIIFLAIIFLGSLSYLIYILLT